MSEIIEVQEALRRWADTIRHGIAIIPSADAIRTLELAADAMDEQAKTIRVGELAEAELSKELERALDDKEFNARLAERQSVLLERLKSAVATLPTIEQVEWGKCACGATGVLLATRCYRCDEEGDSHGPR